MMMLPKETPVGPFHVLPLFGKYRVMDRGAGNRILAPEFNTRSAAETWASKQVPSPQKDTT